LVKRDRGGFFENMLPYNKELKPFARELRKNMTDAERLMWSRLRRRQIKDYQFYRQKILGNYIVDFFCPAAKLVIEIDGGQHLFPEQVRKDAMRDGYLAGLGLTVLRLTDTEVLRNMDGVLERILQFV
jgi:very-short-patch-repair endonuclease